MLLLRVEVPFASFRKSFARIYAETYPFPPPATVYGMLLSLVGERFRARHVGVRLAFAYARQPRVATSLRKLSRYKFGVASKQGKLGNAPDYVETLCGIDFLCWVDSSAETHSGQRLAGEGTLEERVRLALEAPEQVERFGVLCLGLSDDAVDSVSLLERADGAWHWLSPEDRGDLELPVWVDHVGALHTRWRRFTFASQATPIETTPSTERFVAIEDPRPGSSAATG